MHFTLHKETQNQYTQKLNIKYKNSTYKRRGKQLNDYVFILTISIISHSSQEELGSCA